MILDDLANHARERVAAARRALPLGALAEQAHGRARVGRFFEEALAAPGLSFICEVKRASPSKGVISKDFPYLEIAQSYVDAEADCISVLTEPKWFLGSDEVFSAIRARTELPMLRKDFTVDAYQLYEAKVLGADAVLLICALLDAPTLASYLETCDTLGLSAIVEAHDEAEVARAVSAGAAIIGVNNRRLADFTVDTATAERLRALVPAETLFVAESGISSLDEVRAAARFGADAVLVGEFLMRAADRGALLAQMRQAAQ